MRAKKSALQTEQMATEALALPTEEGKLPAIHQVETTSAEQFTHSSEPAPC